MRAREFKEMMYYAYIAKIANVPSYRFNKRLLAVMQNNSMSMVSKLHKICQLRYAVIFLSHNKEKLPLSYSSDILFCRLLQNIK